MLTAPIAEANDRVLSKIHGNRLRSFRHKQPDIGHTCSIARARKSSTPTVSVVYIEFTSSFWCEF